MTETDWLTCADVVIMLEQSLSQMSDRKVRLFSCACCRHIYHLFADNRCGNAVEVAERFADGLASKQDLDGAFSQARTAYQEAGLKLYEDEFKVYPNTQVLSTARVQKYVAAAAVGVASQNLREQYYLYVAPQEWINRPSYDEGVSGNCRSAVGANAELTSLMTCLQEQDFWEAAHNVAARYPAERLEMMRQAAILRDIIGNPFRKVALNSDCLTWNNGTVTKLAEAMYDQQSFERLPILADALGEAGCTNPDIIEHARSVSEHVRGCWLIDLVLGKC